RPGFDIRHHAISVLSLGDFGWIQILNFLLTGVLALLCAIGMRQMLKSGKAGTWGPLLIGIYGIGLIIGGIFHPDPGFGFPPGSPAGMPTTMSTHAAVHSFGFYAAFLSLIAACFVFLRRFASERPRGWAAYCAISAIVSLLFVFLGSATPNLAGILFAIGGAVAFGWVSILSARLVSELREG
ncbi:MAG TPA: DUF998 domain-containing protein, partial [Spirochaetia bacterium]|nr:DUF998 domain-containing protein [Spirochaetia bacterium]